MKFFDWQQYIKNYPDLEHLKTYEQAYAHYTRFGKFEKRVDFIYYHSIFYKNGIIYVIQPIYKEIDMYFKLFDKIGNEIKLTNQIIKDQWEPIIISMFAIGNYSSIDVILKFGIKKICLTLPHIITIKDKFLTLTTMFKDDYKLINIFYEYYKKQGVQHFYLYYNDKLTPDVKKYFDDKDDVTLIEWNYVYHSKNAYISPHIAQTGQMHDAIYHYGKDNTEYMIFCDFDEYLFVKNETLFTYLQKNSTIDTFGFKQILAKIDEDPYTLTSFPKEIQISQTPFQYLCFKETRTQIPTAKCIHKMDRTYTVSVHYHDQLENNLDTSNSFYHFFNWTQTDRTKNEQFIKISLNLS